MAHGRTEGHDSCQDGRSWLMAGLTVMAHGRTNGHDPWHAMAFVDGLVSLPYNKILKTYWYLFSFTVTFNSLFSTPFFNSLLHIISEL